MSRNRWIAAFLFFLLVVSACSSPNNPQQTDWCYRWDYTTSAYSITPASGFWADGLGFYDDETGHLSLSYDAGVSVEPALITVYLDRGATTGDVNITASGTVFGVAASISQTLPGAIDDIPPISFTPANQGDYGSTAALNWESSNTLYLQALEVRGYGQSPFGTSNCDLVNTATPSTPVTNTPSATVTGTLTPTNTPTATATPLEWQHVFDFASSDYTPTNHSYNWISGTGLQSRVNPYNSSYEAIVWQLVVTKNWSVDPTTITYMRVDYSNPAGVSPGLLLLEGNTSGLPYGFNENSGAMPGDGDQSYESTIVPHAVPTGTGDRYFGFEVGTDLNQHTTFYVYRMEVRGTGYDPFLDLNPATPTPTATAPTPTPTQTLIPYCAQIPFNLKANSYGGTLVDGSGSYLPGVGFHMDYNPPDDNSAFWVLTLPYPIDVDSVISVGLSHSAFVYIGFGDDSTGRNFYYNSSLPGGWTNYPIHVEGATTMRIGLGAQFGESDFQSITLQTCETYPTATPHVTNTPFFVQSPTASTTFVASATHTPIPGTPQPTRTLVPFPTAIPTIEGGTPSPEDNGEIGIINTMTDFFTWLTNTITGFFDWLNSVVQFGNGWLTNLGTQIGNIFEAIIGLINLLINFIREFVAIVQLIVAIIQHLFTLVLLWISQFVNSLYAILNAWYGTFPTPIPGMPNCVGAPTASNVCALYYVLQYTIFDGTLGAIIMAVIVVLINLSTIFYFIKTVRNLMVRVRGLFNA